MFFFFIWVQSWVNKKKQKFNKIFCREMYKAECIFWVYPPSKMIESFINISVVSWILLSRRHAKFQTLCDMLNILQTLCKYLFDITSCIYQRSKMWLDFYLKVIWIVPASTRGKIVLNVKRHQQLSFSLQERSRDTNASR